MQNSIRHWYRQRRWQSATEARGWKSQNTFRKSAYGAVRSPQNIMLSLYSSCCVAEALKAFATGNTTAHMQNSIKTLVQAETLAKLYGSQRMEKSEYFQKEHLRSSASTTEHHVTTLQ